MAKKNTQINIRVSEEAKQLIADNAKLLGMKQGEYIETIARKGLNQIVEINNPELEKRIEQIISTLDGIGKNMNQIAIKHNCGNNCSSADIDYFQQLKTTFDKFYLILDKGTTKKTIFNNQEE